VNQSKCQFIHKVFQHYQQEI